MKRQPKPVQPLSTPASRARWPKGRTTKRVGTHDGVWEGRKAIVLRTKKHPARRAGAPKRPKGPNVVPSSVKASVKAVIEEVVLGHKQTIHDAIVDGLESHPSTSHNFVRMCAEYTDGRPDATLNMRATFKEDEMAMAGRALQRKLASLLAAVNEMPEPEP